jgi:hypothetical protein
VPARQQPRVLNAAVVLPVVCDTALLVEEGGVFAVGELKSVSPPALSSASR